ncbi:probable 18S rRNA (guanine-N(7))-methyltransferase isoform X2 [Dysidea avara]|uniref:probable 18S rRNA (guanine-N(7))-methyltransferase isoform X2 n=1 Tax=Dysidea avara TaxID=196820 RepID=UPI003332F721
MASGRPEHRGPPELFYDEKEARKYTQNTRMIEIQMQMAERATELLALPDEPHYLLDIGCGSGLSGEQLTDLGHYWVGVDISEHMLAVAQEGEVEGDLFLCDIGQGLGFRPGSFDGAISISALQWLCNADKKEHHVPKRLFKFFSSLYACLTRGAKAVLQFYPENSAQMELITQQSMKAGFTGGIVIDYPNSAKAKKIFLCLFTAGVTASLPKGLGTGVGENGKPNSIPFAEARREVRKKGSKVSLKSREWVIAKKERRQRQGKGGVRLDSKYTGRRRKPHF